MKQFLQLQPRKWKDLYNFYLSTEPFLNTQTPEEQIETLKNYLTSQGFKEPDALFLAKVLLNSFTEELYNSFIEHDDNPDVSEARLTLYDLKNLKEKLLHEPSADVRRLLVTFAVYARANPHPSFWIKNDKPVINFLASIQKMKVGDQILLTNRLHILYNLDMRVVGSKQPIPCFRLQWQVDQPTPDTPENPLVLIGPLNPATIKSFAEAIPYEEVEPEHEQQ